MSSCGAATQQCLLFSPFPLSTHDAEPSPGLGTGKEGMRVPAPWTLGGGGGSFVGRLPTSRVGHQGVVVKDELRERWEESYWQDGIFLRNLEGMQGRIQWTPPPPLPKCPGRTLQGCVLARGGGGARERGCCAWTGLRPGRHLIPAVSPAHSKAPGPSCPKFHHHCFMFQS